MDTSNKKYTLKKQKGGWYENNFNNFREKAISENDKLKQTDQWWDNLKEELNLYANEMSGDFMAEPRFANMNMDQVQNKLDLINLLGVDIGHNYATMILDLDMPNNQVIELLNARTIFLKEILNIDFVEFIQVLIDFIKSSVEYGELNDISNYRQQDDFTTLGIRRLSKRIKYYSSGWSSHYDLYTNSLMDSVKILEFFLLKAYTGEYGELQNRDMICSDYFFDSIQNENDIIDWVEDYDYINGNIKWKEDNMSKIYDEYENYTQEISAQDYETQEDLNLSYDKLREYQNTLEQMSKDIQTERNKVISPLLELEFDPNIYPELYSKKRVKEIWNTSIQDVLNGISNTRKRYYLHFKEQWKKKLKELKELHRFILYSMLINRNDYDFFGDDKIARNDFDKDIRKTYEQFQVKLVIFYKKLLQIWLDPFDSVEEYMNEINDDKYKNLNKTIDFRFMDLIKCIELQINQITKNLHPRNRLDDPDDSDSDDSDYNNKFPTTRQAHLYDPHLRIDADEDSDDEFERIGHELIDHAKKDWNLDDYTDALGSINSEIHKETDNSIPNDLLENIGRIVDMDSDWSDSSFDNIIIEVYKKDSIINETNIITINKYIYRIAISGKLVDDLSEAELNDENNYLFNRNDESAKRNYKGWVETIDVETNDTILYNIRHTDKYNINDRVFFTFFAKYKKITDIDDGNTHMRHKVIVEMGHIDDSPYIQPAHRRRGKHYPERTMVKIRYINSDMVKKFGWFDVNEINLFKIGALANTKTIITKEYLEYEERGNYLSETFNKFKDKNQDGYATYHLEYSKNKRGNPNLIELLEERGIGGQEFFYDSVEDMSGYAPIKKVNMKELRNLKGIGLDLEKYKKNLFPERIDFLDTIIEDDKELKSEKRPFEAWEERPDGWSSDDELAEEEFDLGMRNKHIKEIIDAKRRGKTRSLQKDWYIKHQLKNIGDDTLEDNPALQTEPIQNILRKSLYKKYGIRSFGQTPMQRINLGQQLRERNSDEGRELASRIDRMERSRNIRSRQNAEILDEELLQQSRLIHGRTPVQVMDLENRLRYRQNRSIGVGDNISRAIDRERRRRDESTRRERELFNLNAV